MQQSSSLETNSCSADQKNLHFYTVPVESSAPPYILFIRDTF
jgi:hypothetical protein